MRPEHCGFGRSLESLTPGDRKAVEDFKAYLEGRVALTADGRTYVPFGDPRAGIAGCGCRWRGEGQGVTFTVRCDGFGVAGCFMSDKRPVAATY